MYVYTQVNFLFVSFFPCSVKEQLYSHGELAQLARASALQAEGQGFEPPILHSSGTVAQLVRAPL